MSDFTPTPTPSYSGKLRNHMLMVPECINECSGIRNLRQNDQVLCLFH